MCAGVPAPIVWKCAWTVLTGKMPQARVTDMCVCVGPPPPMGGDPIITGAWNVLVEGMPAARMTDLTAKGGTIITGFPTVLIGMQGGGASGGGGGGGGLPSLSLFDRLLQMVSAALSIFASEQQLFKDGFDWSFAESADKLSKFFYAEGGLEIEREGLIGRIAGGVDGGLAKWNHSGHFFESFPYFGGYIKGEAIRGQAKGEAGVVGGIGYSGSGKLNAFSNGYGLFVGDDVNNPWVQIGAQAAVGQAEASGESLVGYDGRRAGIAVGGKASAEGFAADAVGEVNIPIPFTDYSVSVRGKAGGDAVSAGGSARGYGFYDTQTERAHIGVAGEASAGLGLGGDLDLSFGKRYDDRNRDSAGF